MHVKSIPSRRLRSEGGFTLIITLSVMLVTSLLIAAAFTASGGDIHLTQADSAAKKAYYAAQAGIDNYEYHLTQDGNYLNYCTAPTPANPALNQYYKEGTATPLAASELHTAEVPGLAGKSSGERYALRLLPAETAPKEDKKCDTAAVFETMIEQNAGAAGTFRLASTGYAEGKARTIVATFKNANFVSYVWYTVYETGDPTLYGENYEKEPEKYAKCGNFYPIRSTFYPYCNPFNNYFINNESINGPMHTADHVGICGKPLFGRNANDRIEFGSKSGSDEGYSTEGACGGEKAEPVFKGTHIPPPGLSLTPPPGDEELEHVVETGYDFSGRTEIILEETQMTVRKEYELNSTTNTLEYKEVHLPFPSNGVVYVSDEGCSTLYSPFGPSPGYTEDSECGNVYVHGKYSQSLTIASENDVIINGNITTTVSSSSNAMLGLIANNFVRVYHPLTAPRGNGYTACKGAGNEEATDLKSPTIDAAILAIKHAFIVDNFDCGKPNLGKLTVHGAIAGLFTNGMTGTFSGTTAQTGYGVNLEYDNRLQVEEPPHFLNPIQAAWYVQRQTLAPNP